MPRKLGDPYDPTLNKLSVNQDQTCKAFWEFGGALAEEASEFDPDSPGQLTIAEIFKRAAEKAPDAALKFIEVVKDEVPLGEDITNIVWGFQNQLKPFRE